MVAAMLPWSGNSTVRVIFRKIARCDRYPGSAKPFLDQDEFAHVIAFDAMTDPLEQVTESQQTDRSPPKRPLTVDQLNNREHAG
jgi:hypothetical protein